MKTINRMLASATFLVVLVGTAKADGTPDIIEFRNGQITWTNVNPALYYTVEWVPTMMESNWTGSFRSLQDRQSSAPTMTADVPMFLRVVGRSNAAYTATLSPTTTVVAAGYYAATNLTQVATQLVAGNIAANVSIFGLTGTWNPPEVDVFSNYHASVDLYGSVVADITTSFRSHSLAITAIVSNQSTTAYGHFKGFALPELSLGTNAFGYDFEGSGVLVQLSTATANKQLISQYPRSYSPLMVLKKHDTFISFAFLYPVLDYKHNSQFAIAYVGGGNWSPTHLTTFFDYPNLPPGYDHSVNAQLAPGTVRVYKMVITSGATLEAVVRPYKTYFDSLYPGGKQYAPDLTPLLPCALAANDAPGYPATNPYGWYSNFVGADTLGFEAVVKPEVLKYIRGDPGDYNLGNDTFMLWTPTGVVDGNLSYPFKFTTRWSAFTGGTTGTVAALRSLVTPGRRMGLWWGHSVDYQPNWNSAVGRAVFDWTNPVHRAAGHAEMTNAIAAGATFIGLDAFRHGLGYDPNTDQTDGHNQLWYILPWLQELKATYPGVKFITEGMACDILHRETATYLAYWNPAKRIHGRHLLADILLPGSEIVTGIYYNMGETAEPGLWQGQPYYAPINEQARLDVVRTAIAYGYVPIPFYKGMSLKNDL